MVAFPASVRIGGPGDLLLIVQRQSDSGGGEIEFLDPTELDQREELPQRAQLEPR